MSLEKVTVIKLDVGYATKGVRRMTLECRSCATTVSRRLWWCLSCINLAYTDLPEKSWVLGGVISASAHSSHWAYLLSKFDQMPIQRDEVNIITVEPKRGKESQSKPKQGSHDGPGIIPVGRAPRRALLKQGWLQGPYSLECKFQQPPAF